MKKYILLFLFISLSYKIINAQISYTGSELTDEQLTSGNEEIIAKASAIIDGIRIESRMKSVIKKGELDGLYLIKLTHVIRSEDIRNGDTIIVILRNVAYGNESNFEPYTDGGYPNMFSQNREDHNINNCELFLKNNQDEISINEVNWQNKKVYELYLTKYGYATVYFKDNRFAEAPYDVYALFNLKFKTRQDWYNYLKKYDNIKVPEGY